MSVYLVIQVTHLKAYHVNPMKRFLSAIVILGALYYLVKMIDVFAKYSKINKLIEKIFINNQHL